jgi:glucose/arabinose dehydrogenase
MFRSPGWLRPAAIASGSGLVFFLVALVQADAQGLPSGFARTQIAQVNAATRMAFAPDGRIFVAELGGRLRVIKNGALLATPFLTVNVAGGGGERGLAGVVLDPNFAANHYVYVYYTARTPTIHSRVSRFTANGDVAVPGSEHIILELDTQTATIHNAGAMKFWHDGTLFISVGENTTPSNAQDLTKLLGKLLRIDVRSDSFPADPSRNYSIPSDNPFRTVSGARPEIWAYGLRNPWSMAIQRGTNRIFINDVGSRVFEEINEGQAGCNYGWPLAEGYTNNPDFCSPFFTYNRNTGFPIGCAIIGGAFYNPPVQKFPGQYVGKYFFADYCNWWIDVLDPTTRAVSSFAGVFGNLSDMDVGPDGNLYYLQIDLTTGISTVYRISYTGSLAPRISTQPTDQLAPVGYPATFTLQADGEMPLSFQWQRNGVTIQGATSSSYTTPAVTLNDNGATYRCVVTNPFGSTTSRAALLSVTTKQPPVPRINLPAPDTYYEAGDTISFAGSAVDGHDIVTGDPQDGVLGPNAFTWQILAEHHPLTNPEHHTHPFFPPTSGIAGGTATLNFVEFDPDVWYRIFFTARDSYGLSTTIFRDIFPRHVQLKVTTNPLRFPVKVDGSPQAAPYDFWSVVNLIRSIGVDTPQVVNGLTYDFVSWSDNGARVHNIFAPPTATGYIANFLKRPGYGSITANPNPIRVTDGSGEGATTLLWSSGQTNKVEVRLGAPGGQLIARSGAGSFTQLTNKSMHDGTRVFLQDVSNNQPLTSAFTLDSVTLHLTTAPRGSITANPDPFLADSQGRGKVTLGWTSYGTSAVEIHVNAPDGNKFAGTGPGTFSAITGHWVRDEMTFYLQDVSNGLPLTAANTLARVKVKAVSSTTPSGSISATPNPFRPDGNGLGHTTLTWTSALTTKVQVRVNAPDGNRVAESGPGTFSTQTGQWVRDGMTFYLQNVSNGLPLTSANTLARITVRASP